MIRFFTVIMVSLFLFANFVQAEEPYVPKEKEELYGTWTNEEYDGKNVNSRWVFNSDGTWASYRDTSGDPIWAGPYSITAKWTDAEDNVWYKLTWKNKYSGGSGYGLHKISDSGETIEGACSIGDYPAKIDPTKPFWQYIGIHYHQKSGLKASGQEKQEFSDEQKAVVPSTMGQVVNSVPSIESHVEISKLVTDSSGETHFATEKVAWLYWFYGGYRTQDKPVTSFQFYHLKKNLDMGLHPAPRKQFLLIIQGTLQIETSDGEQRQFSPGSVLLVTDIGLMTKGHKTSVIGEEDVFAAVLAIP